MRTLKNALFSVSLFAAVLGSSELRKAPVTIEGKVVAESTNKPIQNAHVFILDGEEEALTNSEGEFRIQSWQKTPFKLTVKSYNQYRDASIVITDPSRRQVIRLKSK